MPTDAEAMGILIVKTDEIEHAEGKHTVLCTHASDDRPRMTLL